MNYLSNMVKKYLGFNKSKRNGGYALPMVLVMLSLLAALSVYLLNRNIKELEANQKSLDYELCILTAKNAMEEIKGQINQDGAIIESSQEEANGGSYHYRILKTDDHHYRGELRSVYRSYEKNFFVTIELDQGKQIKNFFWEME